MSKTKAAILAGVEGIDHSKIVDNNTVKIAYKDGRIAYRLHETDVVTILPNGDRVLSSGGWRTSTTKDRINKYGGVRLSQTKGLWYVNGVPFYDGIRFSDTGELIGKMKQPNMEAIEKTRKQIAAYVKLVTKDNLPKPSPGDCFDCSLRTPEGKSMGDTCGNTDHLRLHMKEKYIPGWLLVNAMLEAGYRNDGQLGLFYEMKMADAFRRALRKYLTKRLLPEIAK